MSSEIEYLKAEDYSDPESLVPQATKWSHAAGNPYFDWLFGDPEWTAKVMERWTRRPPSEVYVNRYLLLLVDGQVAGGVSVLAPKDLMTARKSDMLSMLKAIPPEDPEGFKQRLRDSKGLFPLPEEDEFFISKFSIDPEFRGRGYGRPFFEAGMDLGRQLGFRKFRLDVSCDNQIGQKIYSKIGYSVLKKSETPGGEIAYYSMVCPGQES